MPPITANNRSPKLNIMDQSLYEREKVYLLRQVHAQYKLRAKREKQKFNLAVDEVVRLIQQPCHYCGAENSNCKRSAKIQNLAVRHNGIDRYVHERGYVESNVVPCCCKCNYAKGRRHPDEFMQWLYQAGQHVHANFAPSVVSDSASYLGEFKNRRTK